MKIVITARDFSSTDPGAAENLKNSGFEVCEYEDAITQPIEERFEMLKDADGVIVGPEPMPESLLVKLPRLQIISRRGIGTDSIDMAAAERLGITVTRTLGLVEESVAELIVSYLLWFGRDVSAMNAAMHDGEWKRILAHGIKGRKLGLLGFGGISKELIKKIKPFGMEIICNYRHRKPEEEAAYGVTWVEFDTLLAESDYLSVNVPLTEQTRGLFQYEQICKMKETAVLINVARGAVVNAADLARALREKKIRGAAVDVYEEEPCTDSPLIECEGAVLTPHIGPYTLDNFKGMNDKAAENIIAYFGKR